MKLTVDEAVARNLAPRVYAKRNYQYPTRVRRNQVIQVHPACLLSPSKPMLGPITGLRAKSGYNLTETADCSKPAKFDIGWHSQVLHAILLRPKEGMLGSVIAICWI